MRKVTLYPKANDTLVLSVDNTTEANLRIGTYSGVGCVVDWGDGNVEILPPGSTVTHVYATNFTGDVLVTPLEGYLDIRVFESTGSTAWSFDLGVFVPLTGLREFRLTELPNASITGSLNSFTGANNLGFFRIINLPNANIDGSINSFSGATGLRVFRLYNLPNTNITGDSSAFANKTNLGEFLILTSSTSNIVMNYDDILNIWQPGVYIIHWDSGISASKVTTSPFNFNSLIEAELRFQGIGLSTQSMDNMIIALDDSLIAQTGPKNIYLNNNAAHSGSPAVMTALASLAAKNVTTVL